MSAQLPIWAKSPGPDWHHRENYSDTDVVWYHQPTNGVMYQLGPDDYMIPEVVKPTVTRRRWFWHRVVLVSASVSTVVSVGMHFVPWR